MKENLMSNDPSLSSPRLTPESEGQQPRKIGCMTYFCVAVFVLVVLFWYNMLRSVPLKIAPETTYITEPRTPDGRFVDYIAAIEQRAYPPEMRTDDNGFRMVLRAIGPIEKTDPEVTRQRYEKLGLDDIFDKPTLAFIDADNYISLRYKYRPEDFDTIVAAMIEKQRENQPEDIGQNDSEPEGEATDFTFPVPVTEDFGQIDAWKVSDFIRKSPDIHKWPIMQEWLEANTPALDFIVEASKKPVFVTPFVMPKDAVCTYDILLPDVQGIRSFVRGLEARARIRVSEGDIDGAIEDILACSRLGRHTRRYACCLVQQLVGIACEGIALSSAYNGNLMSQATAEQLKRLMEGLNDLPQRGTWEDCMEMERLSTLDALIAIMKDPANLNKILDNVYGSSSKHPAQDAVYAAITWSGKDWNVIFRKVNESFDQVIAGTPINPTPSLDPLRYITLGARSEAFTDMFLGIFFPATEAAREASRRQECADNLKRVQLAMFLYHAEHGTLPPAWSIDANGKPLHSWRVLLLPYLGDASLAELYSQIRLDEPWDSEHNRQFHGRNLDVYRCPSAGGNDGDSHYAVITGDGLLFTGDGKGQTLAGHGINMLMVVERKEGICWMLPDSNMSQAVAEAGQINKGSATVGGYHTGGCNFALRDGSVIFISGTIRFETFIDLVRGTAKERPGW
jgi:hypothetical protein